MCNEIFENGRSQKTWIQAPSLPYLFPKQINHLLKKKKKKTSLQLLIESFFFQRIVHIYLGITLCSCVQLFDIATHCCLQSSRKKHSCFVYFFFLELLQIKPNSLHPRQELYYWETTPIQRLFFFYSSLIQYISTTISPPFSPPRSSPLLSSPTHPLLLQFPLEKRTPPRDINQTKHNKVP